MSTFKWRTKTLVLDSRMLCGLQSDGNFRVAMAKTIIALGRQGYYVTAIHNYVHRIHQYELDLWHADWPEVADIYTVPPLLVPEMSIVDDEIEYITLREARPDEMKGNEPISDVPHIIVKQTREATDNA